MGTISRVERSMSESLIDMRIVAECFSITVMTAVISEPLAA
jgi:hypothetical protein